MFSFILMREILMGSDLRQNDGWRSLVIVYCILVIGYCYFGLLLPRLTSGMPLAQSGQSFG